jgi:hypothetical protein
MLKKVEVDIEAEGEEPPHFWDILGGQRSYAQLSALQVSPWALQTLRRPRIFRCTEVPSHTGMGVNFEVSELRRLLQQDLANNPRDGFLLDVGVLLFVCYGSESNTTLRSRMSKLAVRYVRASAAFAAETDVVAEKSGEDRARKNVKRNSFIGLPQTAAARKPSDGRGRGASSAQRLERQSSMCDLDKQIARAAASFGTGGDGESAGAVVVEVEQGWEPLLFSMQFRYWAGRGGGGDEDDEDEDEEEEDEYQAEVGAASDGPPEGQPAAWSLKKLKKTSKTDGTSESGTEKKGKKKKKVRVSVVKLEGVTKELEKGEEVLAGGKSRWKALRKSWKAKPTSAWYVAPHKKQTMADAVAEATKVAEVAKAAEAKHYSPFAAGSMPIEESLSMLAGVDGDARVRKGTVVGDAAAIGVARMQKGEAGGDAAAIGEARMQKGTVVGDAAAIGEARMQKGEAGGDAAAIGEARMQKGTVVGDAAAIGEARMQISVEADAARSDAGGAAEDAAAAAKKRDEDKRSSKANAYLRQASKANLSGGSSGSNAVRQQRRTSAVGAELSSRMKEECETLRKDIQRLGAHVEGKWQVNFGVLFDDEQASQYYEVMVNTLKAAKKRGWIDFKGQMLLKGAHDSVPIILLQPLSAADDIPKEGAQIRSELSKINADEDVAERDLTLAAELPPPPSDQGAPLAPPPNPPLDPKCTFAPAPTAVPSPPPSASAGTPAPSTPPRPSAAGSIGSTPLGGSQKCKVCNTTVYPNDSKQAYEGSTYHKGCFKCTDCACQLTLSNVAILGGVVLCKVRVAPLMF